jgi:AcrR family transcriptional regulator
MPPAGAAPAARAMSDDDPILDAARATVLDFGVSRATVIEVARRAGVSRMTVYRRYPDGDALVRALMAREFAELMKRADEHAAPTATARERIVASALHTVELLVTDPVLLRLLEVDIETLLPYFIGEPGRFQRTARERLVEYLRAGQADGSVRAGHPELMAVTAELSLRGVVLGARALEPSQRAALLRELGLMLDAYLRP